MFISCALKSHTLHSFYKALLKYSIQRTIPLPITYCNPLNLAIQVSDLRKMPFGNSVNREASRSVSVRLGVVLPLPLIVLPRF